MSSGCAQGFLIFWKTAPIPERLSGVLKAILFSRITAPGFLVVTLYLKALPYLDQPHEGFLVVPLFLKALLYLDQPLKGFLRAPRLKGDIWTRSKP